MIKYGMPRRTTRVPRSEDTRAMVRAQDKMALDKAIYDNQTAWMRPDFSNVQGGMSRRGRAGKALK